VIPLCAALAAQEHGDARRALDLLRMSAEIAERKGARKVTKSFVRIAQNKIEIDRVIEVIKTLPTQSKLILIAIFLLERHEIKKGSVTTITTGEVYEIYKNLCKKTRTDVLTQRRVGDLISELDMLGIITARVISKGRYGRTREIKLSTNADEIMRILEKDEVYADLSNYKISAQTRLI
jgi:cell division control protein 6